MAMIGQPLNRVDGPLKVAGQATYAAPGPGPGTRGRQMAGKGGLHRRPAGMGECVFNGTRRSGLCPVAGSARTGRVSPTLVGDRAGA
jgi:hypothetical protein